MVSMIQECHCGWISFGITPNLVQEISFAVSKLHSGLFHPLIVSINGTTMSYPQPKLSPGDCSSIAADWTRSPMKDIISVKYQCLLSLQLVEMLLSCINQYQCVF